MLVAWQLRMLKRSAHKLFISDWHIYIDFTVYDFTVNVGQYTKKNIECLGYGIPNQGFPVDVVFFS